MLTVDVDIATKLELLEIIWITRMLDNNFHTRKATPPHTFDIQKLFHKNLNLFKPVKSEINPYPKFYQEVTSIREKVCIKEPVDIAEILSLPI